ncbi:hypothetical protein BC940DRAFT_323592 [Gongronella butleri]|nr:hypothetical protein BC940DRAFT_323592 [Gongronella butleri]
MRHMRALAVALRVVLASSGLFATTERDDNYTRGPRCVACLARLVACGGMVVRKEESCAFGLVGEVEGDEVVKGHADRVTRLFHASARVDGTPEAQQNACSGHKSGTIAAFSLLLLPSK